MEYSMTANDVCVSYGGKEALHHVNLNFPKGMVTALIGPSGCGKSTFLRSLNRMNNLIPGCKVTGRITLDGRDVNTPDTDVVELRRRVGMVFQKPNPFPKSIYENVAYGLRVNGVKDEGLIAGRVEQALKRAAILTRSRTGFPNPPSACPAASSRGCALPEPLPLSPTSCSWTNPPALSTP